MLSSNSITLVVLPDTLQQSYLLSHFFFSLIIHLISFACWLLIITCAGSVLAVASLSMDPSSNPCLKVNFFQYISHVYLNIIFPFELVSRVTFMQL